MVGKQLPQLAWLRPSSRRRVRPSGSFRATCRGGVFLPSSLSSSPAALTDTSPAAREAARRGVNCWRALASGSVYRSERELCKESGQP